MVRSSGFHAPLPSTKNGRSNRGAPLRCARRKAPRVLPAAIGLFCPLTHIAQRRGLVFATGLPRSRTRHRVTVRLLILAASMRRAMPSQTLPRTIFAFRRSPRQQLEGLLRCERSKMCADRARLVPDREDPDAARHRRWDAEAVRGAWPQGEEHGWLKVCQLIVGRVGRTYRSNHMLVRGLPDQIASTSRSIIATGFRISAQQLALECSRGGPSFAARVLMRIQSNILVVFLISCLTRVSVACAGVDVIDAHARYPEGPLWDHGRLLYVEYAGDDIKAWDGTEPKTYWHKEHCGANALIHFRGDHILVACYDGNYLVELDAQGKELRTITKDSLGKPFIGPNDFTADGHGGIYFSASGVYDVKAPITGAVLHLSANGED